MEKNDLNQQIGSRIEALRTKLGISRAEFARRMEEQPGLEKYNAMTVKRTEDGERSLRIEEMLGVASVLGVSIDALLSKDEESYEESARYIELTKALSDYERLKVDLILLAEELYGSIKKLQDYFEELDRLGERPAFKKAKLLRAFEVANSERIYELIEAGASRGRRELGLTAGEMEPWEEKTDTAKVFGVEPTSFDAQLPFEDYFYEFVERLKQQNDEDGA